MALFLRKSELREQALPTCRMGTCSTKVKEFVSQQQRYTNHDGRLSGVERISISILSHLR